MRPVQTYLFWYNIKDFYGWDPLQRLRSRRWLSAVAAAIGIFKKKKVFFTSFSAIRTLFMKKSFFSQVFLPLKHFSEELPANAVLQLYYETVANPTIVSYNASATNSIARFRMKIIVSVV
jgi:hypothetical protein